MTTKHEARKQVRQARQRKVAKGRDAGTPREDWGICSVCGDRIMRLTWPGEGKGVWWHVDFPGRDKKHKPVPRGGLRGVLDSLKGGA